MARSAGGSGPGRKRKSAVDATSMEDDEEVVDTTPAPGRGARAAASQQPSQQPPQPARASQRHQHWDEDDEEIVQFEEEIRKYNTEADRAAESERTKMSTTEEELLVKTVMRVMIFRNEVKPGVPVPRGDLTKLFPAQRRAAAATVVKLAQAKFPDALGLEMKEIKVSSAKAPAGSDDGSKYYVLRSYLPKSVRMQAWLQRPGAQAHQAFELTVLALIVMNGDRISEDDLWRLLEDVGVTKTIGTRETHPVIVKPEEKIKHMVARRYLKSLKGRGGEPAVYEWGANAEDEIGRSAVNHFIKETIEG